MEPNEAEFTFDSQTDKGYCKLCDVTLTSAAHAQQHLQGQKHTKKHDKEKKRWRTISAFSRSAAVGPAPATSEETRGAEGMSTGSSAGMLGGGGDVQDAPLIDLGDNTDQTVATAGSVAVPVRGPGGDGGGTGKAMASENPDEEIFRDQSGQVWYKCVPCNKPLNTLDQLQIHQKSPKHLKNAAKPKPNVVSFPVTTPGTNANNAASASGQSGLMTDGGGGDVTDAAQNDTILINGQIWYRCHVCNCDVNTRQMLRIHQQSPKHKKAKERAALAGTGSSRTATGGLGTVQGLGMDRTVWHTCEVCNKRLNSVQQLSTHMQSHGRAVSNMTIDPPLGPAVSNRASDCPAGATSGLSFDRFLPMKGNIDDIEVVRAGTALKQHLMEQARRTNSSSGGSEASPGRGEPARRNGSTGVSEFSPGRGEPARRDGAPGGSDESPRKQTLSPGISSMETTSPQPNNVDAARKKEEQGIDDALIRIDDREELSSGCHGNNWRIVTDGGAGAAADDLAVQMGSLSLNTPNPIRTPGPTSPRLNPDNPIGAPGPAPVSASLCPEDPIRAPCSFEPCFYHCGVCDIHLSGLSPKIDHMDSMKHLKNLKRRGLFGVDTAAPGDGGGGGGSGALESDGLIRIIQKPRSPNTPPGYYNYCDICRVPFSGPEAQAAHERGKQHRAQAAKSSPAPVRDLPGIVKHPYGGDTTDSRVLTKTEPRQYQVELYMKAMAADSVIFLPTGE